MKTIINKISDKAGEKVTIDCCEMTQEIINLSKRLPIVNELIDEKSMRWLELSEIG